MKNNIIKTIKSILKRISELYMNYREKKQARKDMKKARKRNSYKYSDFSVSAGKARNEFMTIVILVIIAIFLIVIGNIYALCKISENAIVYDQAVQSTLLSTGLSIIAIAIAVWAGLNIIQILGNNRLNEIFKQYSQFEKERKELYKIQFLHELKQQDRVMAQYLCNRIQMATRLKDDIPSNVYYRLHILEKNYENVYSKQTQKIRKYDEYSLVSLSTEIKDIRDEISNVNVCMENYLAIDEYLKSRSAELYFNYGYDDSDDFILDSIVCFKNTIEIYQSLYFVDEYLKNNYVEKGKNGELITFLLSGMKHETNNKIKMRCAIHIVNTIAESYSKLAHKYLIISDKDGTDIASVSISKESALDYISKAIYLYECLINYKNKNKDYSLDEFIFRNYGAALERQCKLLGRSLDYFRVEDMELVNEIRDKYLIALKKELSVVDTKNMKEGVFYAYGSFYVKVIGNIPIFYKLDAEKRLDVEKWTDSVYQYMKLATALLPKQIVFYKLLGIAMTYKISFMINRNELDEIQKEVLCLKNLIEKITIISSVKDSYMARLENNWTQIIRELYYFQ